MKISLKSNGRYKNKSMNTKFYIDTEANDDKAYRLAMQFACELAKKDSNMKKIVLYIHTKQNTGWYFITKDELSKISK